MAAEKDQAKRYFYNFLQIYEAKYPKAAECLEKIRDVLLTFYDFSAEHMEAYPHEQSDWIYIFNRRVKNR